jgi:hypothetical protein
VPAARFAGSVLFESTMKRWRPFGVSITSSLALTATTVPLSVLVGVPGGTCTGEPWARRLPASASAASAARPSKRCLRMIPPPTGGERRSFGVQEKCHGMKALRERRPVGGALF